jgi:hypothetical protein
MFECIQTETEVHFVMELAAGDLYDAVIRDRSTCWVSLSVPFSLYSPYHLPCAEILIAWKEL